jgi:dihydrofolate reductase
MGKIIVGTTMSLDGFMNDRIGSVASLYPALVDLRKTQMLQESIEATGAVVMGRHAYDMAQGDLTGYEYQVPIFVLTHHLPTQEAKGQNDQLKVIFVTDGIESAISQATAAGGEKDVTIVGGAKTAQQCLNAGFCDEIHIGIMPIMLGGGLRFFDNLALENVELQKIDVLESGARTDLRFRVIRK